MDGSIPTAHHWARLCLSAMGTMLLTVAGLATAPSAAADAAFAADAENGWVVPPWSAAAGSTSLTRAARTGLRGYEVAGHRSQGYLRWQPSRASSGSYFSVRAWVQVKSRGVGESVDLITVRNTTGLRNFDFFVTGDTRRFKWDLFREDRDQADFVVQYDRWYLVEAYGEFEGSRWQAGVRIDGVDQGVITSDDNATARVESVVLGTMNYKTHRQYYDDVSATVTAAPVSWSTANR